MTLRSELLSKGKYLLIISFLLFTIKGFSFSNYNTLEIAGTTGLNPKMKSSANLESLHSANPSSNIEYKYDGDIIVTDDDKAIKSISPGGYLKFSIKTFGNKRIIKITSDSKGVLHYEYFENKQELNFDPDGRQLLAEVLVDILRLSGIDAENRTLRIYNKSGVDGFITEILSIP